MMSLALNAQSAVLKGTPLQAARAHRPRCAPAPTRAVYLLNDPFFDDPFFRAPRLARRRVPVAKDPFRWMVNTTQDAAALADIVESEREYQITANVPGVPASGVTLDLAETDRVLKVECRGRNGDKVFSKRYSLPADVAFSDIKASCVDGVLQVRARVLGKSKILCSSSPSRARSPDDASRLCDRCGVTPAR